MAPALQACPYYEGRDRIQSQEATANVWAFETD